MSKFKITEAKGFGLTFDNGFTISIQWGAVNYCSNSNLSPEVKTPNNIEAISAEVAVIDSELRFLDLGKDEEDSVIGWVSPDNVAKMIAIVQSSKTSEEIKDKINSLNL